MSEKSAPGPTEIATARFEAPGMDGVIEAVRKRDAEVVDRAFEAGFRLGWEKAHKRIKELLAVNPGTIDFDLRTSEVKFGDSTVVMRDHKGNALTPPLSKGQPIGTKEIVLSFVRKMPGLKGIDLIEKINSDGFDLHERTIRTALHRLKNSGDLKVVDGRWYSRENAPPDPLSLLEKEDNDAAAS